MCTGHPWCAATIPTAATLLICYSFSPAGIVLSFVQSKSAFFGQSGYVRFNDSSVRLSGGENRLELRFRPCEASGLLLYATSEYSLGLYFALGLYSSQLLIEFTDETGLKEVTVCAGITCLPFLFLLWKAT